MALVWKNSVFETTTVTGTGAATLLGKVAGYQDFTAIGDGNTVNYTIRAVDSSGVPTGDWETGQGTYTLAGTSLSRDTIYESSNGGAAVNFSAGTKWVFSDMPAEYLTTLATAAAILHAAINTLSGLITADGYASTITFDASLSDQHTVTLAGNPTLAITGDTNGQSILLYISQGTGGNTVTWWSGIKWQGGSAPTLSTGAGVLDVISITRLGSGSYVGAASLNYH